MDRGRTANPRSGSPRPSGRTRTPLSSACGSATQRNRCSQSPTSGRSNATLADRASPRHKRKREDARSPSSRGDATFPHFRSLVGRSKSLFLPRSRLPLQPTAPTIATPSAVRQTTTRIRRQKVFWKVLCTKIPGSELPGEKRNRRETQRADHQSGRPFTWLKRHENRFRPELRLGARGLRAGGTAAAAPDDAHNAQSQNQSKQNALHGTLLETVATVEQTHRSLTDAGHSRAGPSVLLDGERVYCRFEGGSQPNPRLQVPSPSTDPFDPHSTHFPPRYEGNEFIPEKIPNGANFPLS